MTWRSCCLLGATGWGCFLSATIALSGSPAVEHFVWPDSPAPAPPYLTWENAAHTIQEAVDVTAEGDLVVVTNGIYATGSRRISEGAPLNHVVINRPVTVISVNGPDLTVIEGSQGEEAIRCAFVGTNATLSGFTLANGLAREGGGVWSEWSGVVTNCWIKNNRAELDGGGVTGGLVLNSTISNNDSAL